MKRPITVKKNDLANLQYWLDYELGSTILFTLSFFYGIALWLSIVAALAFLPLLIKVLVQQRRFGWLSVLVVFILTPPLIVYLFMNNWTLVSLFISLGLFYTYCAFLKIIIPSWFRY